MAVARAHAAATADADTTAAGCAHVVIGEADCLRRIDRGRLLHLLRSSVGHRHFGHVEILHLVAATTAAARFQVHHDQFAPTLFVHRDDQEEQREHVQCNRQGKGPDQQTERIFHFLQTRRIRLVIFAIGLGQQALACRLCDRR